MDFLKNVKNIPLHGSIDSKFMAHSRDIEAVAIKCKCQLHILICDPPAPPPAAGAEQKSTPNSFSPLETHRTPTIPHSKMKSSSIRSLPLNLRAVSLNPNEIRSVECARRPLPSHPPGQKKYNRGFRPKIKMLRTFLYIVV